MCFDFSFFFDFFFSKCCGDFFRDEDALVNSKCPKNLELRWQTEVSSSIYANPLVADINRLMFLFVLFLCVISDLILMQGLVG